MENLCNTVPKWMEFLVRNNTQNNTVSLLEGVYQLNACLSLIRLHRKQPFYCGQSDGILIISTDSHAKLLPRQNSTTPPFNYTFSLN